MTTIAFLIGACGMFLFGVFIGGLAVFGALTDKKFDRKGGK